jgi:hypothetical protein
MLAELHREHTQFARSHDMFRRLGRSNEVGRTITLLCNWQFSTAEENYHMQDAFSPQ